MKINPIVILPFIMLALILAIWGGWIRIGWNLPLTKTAGHHGAIMVGSFLSSLIFLERAVTFKNKLILLLPLVNALSIVAFITGFPWVAHLILLAGSVGFCGMCIHFIYRYKEQYYYLFFAGAFCLATGNWLLLNNDIYPQAVPWWMGFFLFTIVAERLELSRFLQVSKAQHNLLFAALAVSFTVLIIPFHLYGSHIFAAGLLLTSLWLMKFDMAFRSLSKAGQHRYSGLLLIVGYVWLIITAVFLFSGDVNAFWYDATLHAFFIGFVFSMIFSHAPIILPAVLKLPVKPFRPILYIWFSILQASLITRIAADYFIEIEIRRWAGMMNGLIILSFFINMAIIIKTELKQKQSLTKT